MIGAVALYDLPVAQYPDVVPPTVQVTTRYPGASATTLIDTVALPIEQQVNGVEDMIYMQSTSARRRHLHADGHLQDRHRPQFRAGPGAEPGRDARCRRCRRRCRPRASTVQKKSTAILLFVTLTSPDSRYDSLYLANYATINLQDELSRLPGVGNVNVFGAGQYAMRIWLDPNKLQARALTTQDVITAVQQQNRAGHRRPGRHAAGAAPTGLPIYARMSTGRLDDVDQFEQHHRQDRRQRRGHAHPRHRPRRTRRADL